MQRNTETETERLLAREDCQKIGELLNRDLGKLVPDDNYMKDEYQILAQELSLQNDVFSEKGIPEVFKQLGDIVRRMREIVKLHDNAQRPNDIEFFQRDYGGQSLKDVIQAAMTYASTKQSEINRKAETVSSLPLIGGLFAKGRAKKVADQGKELGHSAKLDKLIVGLSPSVKVHLDKDIRQTASPYTKYILTDDAINTKSDDLKVQNQSPFRAK